LARPLHYLLIRGCGLYAIAPPVRLYGALAWSEHRRFQVVLLSAILAARTGDFLSSFAAVDPASVSSGYPESCTGGREILSQIQEDFIGPYEEHP
jgi:hypothetical protein